MHILSHMYFLRFPQDFCDGSYFPPAGLLSSVGVKLLGADTSAFFCTTTRNAFAVSTLCKPTPTWDQ